MAADTDWFSGSLIGKSGPYLTVRTTVLLIQQVVQYQSFKWSGLGPNFLSCSILGHFSIKQKIYEH